MAIVKGKLGRLCKKCGKRFEPLGKYNKLCIECWEGSNKRRDLLLWKKYRFLDL